MGLLAAAGMISGAGHAAEKGLDNVQQAWTVQMLQNEREKWEMERTKFMEDMANQRHQQTLGQNVVLHSLSEQGQNERQKASEAGANQRHQESLGQNVVLHSLNEQGQTQRHAATIARDQEKQQADIGKDMVLQSMKGEQARIAAAASGEKKLDPAVKAQIEFQMDKLKGVQKRMEGGLLPPAELAAAQQEVDAIGTTIDRLVGQSTAPKPAGIVDRFKQAPPAVPQPSGMIPAAKASAGQPGYTPGQEEFQDFIDRVRPRSTRPAGAPTVPMQP